MEAGPSVSRITTTSIRSKILRSSTLKDPQRSKILRSSTLIESRMQSLNQSGIICGVSTLSGNPRRRAIEAELSKRAAESGESSGLDYACTWIGSGQTMAALADDISRTVGLNIMPDQLGRWLHGQENGDAALLSARARGAHGLVDQAMAITDAGGVDRDGLTHAKMRSDVRLWVAERWNREAFASRNGPQVQISIGSLHLDALRVRTLPDAIAGAIIEDAEVLSLEESTG